MVETAEQFECDSSLAFAELRRRRRTGARGKAVRWQTGQQLIELAVGLIVLIPVILALFDCIIVIMAVNLNDHACRDSARIAAAGRPTQTEISKRAQGALSTFKGGGYVTGPSLVSAQGLNVTPDPSNPPISGGPYQGDVEVQTQVVVSIPVSIPGLSPSQVTFNSKQRFPISFVEPVSSTFTPPP